MLKRWIVSGLLSLSAFAYSDDLADAGDKSDHGSIQPSAHPTQKQVTGNVIPQEHQQDLQQAASPSQNKSLSVRKLKRKPVPSSLSNRKKAEIASNEGVAAEKKQIAVAEAIPSEPVAAPIKKKREQPMAAPLKSIESEKAAIAHPVEQAAVAPVEALEQESVAVPANEVAKPQLADPVQRGAPASVAVPARKKSKKIANRNRSVKQQPLSPSSQVAVASNPVVEKKKPDSSPVVPAEAQVITTPTAPIVKDNDNLFFGLEYLIMTTSEGGLSYARQNTQGENHCYDTDFDWNSGFRFRFGYNMGHDRWDLQMVWSWLLTRGNDAKTDRVNQLYATNSSAAINPQSGVLANAIQSHINLHLNLWDTKIGREFFVSKWLTLHPAAGLKVGWVNQHWQTTATGDIKALNLTTVTEYTIDMKQKFWGIGPMLGIDSEWGLIGNFHLYANGSVAFLTGFFNDYRNDIATQVGEPDIINPFRRHSHQPQWVSELQLGLRWNQWMSRNRYRLAILAGWNAIFFNDHNHLFSISGSDSVTSYGQTQQLIDANGDLMSQGFSVGLRLDF